MFLLWNHWLIVAPQKFETSHAKTFLKVSVRTAQCTTIEWIRNGSTNRSKRIHWTTKQLKKICERMRSNGWTAKENIEQLRLNGWGTLVFNRCGRTAEETFWTYEVEWLEQIFERMRSNSWTAEEIFEWHTVKWTISLNLQDRGIPRHLANRRSERDMSGSVKCHSVSCSWHVRCGVSGQIMAWVRLVWLVKGNQGSDT